MPVSVDNDVNVIALGEYMFGSGRNARCMVCMAVGTGIGGGIIIQGKIHHGATNYAAEFGHININFEGIPCNCGRYGYLEFYASGPAMIKRCVAGLEKGVDSLIREKVRGDYSKISPLLNISFGSVLK